ncbi:MAG: CinA family protein [Nocardioides marinisabuli]|uniref:CinA family protein n=1 Tax=Nocardioides marinisabuli TaxID=419476 RepID=UPI00321A1380
MAEEHDRAERPAAALHAVLRSRGETLATAESLTGGLLAGLLTDVLGASATYVGGLVTYATELKQGLLGVPAELVAEHGVVSAPCAEAMAGGALAATGATWALSTTGVAGPDLQEGHPVGTVFVGVAGPGVLRSVRLQLDGGRAEVRRDSCAAAVSVLTDILEGCGGEERVLR